MPKYKLCKNQCQYVFKSGRRRGLRCTTDVRDQTQNLCGTHRRSVARTAETQQRNKAFAKTALREDNIFQGSANRLNGGSFTAPKPRNVIDVVPVDNRFSTYLITINSQKGFRNMDEQTKRNYKKFHRYMFDSNNILDFFTDGLNPDDPRENLKDATSQYYFEVGPRFGKLHTHAVVNLTHVGNYKLDIAKLKNFARQVLGYVPYINVSASGNPTRAMEQYAAKMRNKIKI